MIIAVAMVRDEADILSAFLAHATSLFDAVLVADHASTDATPAILAAAGPNVATWRVTTAGYWQSAVTTLLAREAFGRGAAWVFPLDADEFLDIPDRAALRALMARQTEPSVFFRWRHAMPHGEAWLANPLPAPGGRGKVAIHRRLAERLPGFALGAGNHGIQAMPFAKAIAGPDAGMLWHLPVRSRAQFLQKLRRDIASHTDPQGRPTAGMEAALTIKRGLLDRLEAAPEDDALLREIALGYWEGDAPRAAPVPVKPAVVIPPVPEPASSASPVTAMGTLPPSTRAAVARFDGASIRVKPAAAAVQRAATLEAWLTRRFTPGLRLARFAATRLVRRRLR